VEIVYERVAAIDVGKKIVAVAVRTPGERAGKRRVQVRKFSTYYRTLSEMVAWLVGEGVTHVTMEATGVYWRPVFHALCEAERPLEVLLVNARHVKNVPGRKSDALDAVWLAELTECGLLRGQFHPAGADRGDPGVDPLPQKAHPGAHQRAPAAGEGP
jgi:transposase